MNRPFLPALSAAFITAALFYCFNTAEAQAPAPTLPVLTTPPVPPVTAPMPVAPESSTTQTTPAPTSYAHHYLSQKVTLTEGSKIFYVQRARLGCSFADGISDLTVDPFVRYIVDQDVLTAYLTQLKPRIDNKALPAHPVLVTPIPHPTLVKSDNIPRPATIIPATSSVSLLVPDSAAAITTALKLTPLATSYPLVVQTGNFVPKSASLTGIDSRIAHFVTHFDPYEVGRTVTVKRAIQLCDGYVLQPGQIFSINKVVGIRTAARGFGIGKVFINGTMQDQVGGGMCQVATTLYNAALLGNLTIIERHQHVRTVPYVPAGGDATVYYGEKDFQFENNTQTPIYISYRTLGTHCIVDLYGKGEPGVKVRVQTIATQLGPRYFTGVLRRFVTIDGKTTNDYTSYSSYKWTPSLDYQR
jgi:hypothetical protein